jgi:hypothetical protein
VALKLLKDQKGGVKEREAELTRVGFTPESWGWDEDEDAAVDCSVTVDAMLERCDVILKAYVLLSRYAYSTITSVIYGLL